MNAQESSDWYAVMRGLQTGATEHDLQRGQEAVRRLTEAAHALFSRYPTARQIGVLYAGATLAIDRALMCECDENAWATVVALPDRPVEDAPIREGLL